MGSSMASLVAVTRTSPGESPLPLADATQRLAHTRAKACDPMSPATHYDAQPQLSLIGVATCGTQVPATTLRPWNRRQFQSARRSVGLIAPRSTSSFHDGTQYLVPETASDRAT